MDTGPSDVPIMALATFARALFNEEHYPAQFRSISSANQRLRSVCRSVREMHSRQHRGKVDEIPDK